MYIVRLRGGLGNQLFQYALCEFLSRFSGDVYVDDSEYKCFKCHDGLEVDRIFEVYYPGASSRDIIKSSNCIPIRVGGRFGILLFELERIREELVFRINHKKTHITDDEIDRIDNKELYEFLEKNRTHTLYFDGYWMSTRFIDMLGEGWLQFREDFTDKYRKYQEGLDFDKLCSIHVRKGDYTGTPMDVCNEAYYRRAMEYIRELRSDVGFIVFSDEIDKARMLIGDGSDISYMDTSGENTAGVDVWLMSLCRDNIIANSTYSYWGSRLNRHIDKCVIMPTQYRKFQYENSVII